MASPNVFKQEIDRLAPHLWQAPRQLKRGELLTTPGSASPFTYYVAAGTLRVFVEQGDEELTIRFGYSGDFIAPLDAFLSSGPTSFYIQALKKSTVLPLHKNDFLHFRQQHPQINTLWLQALEQLVLQQLDREIDILTAAPQERYQRVWQRSPRLFQEIPHKYIASYLRMSPETLSRLKKS